VFFGQNAVHAAIGTVVRVGDSVEALAVRCPYAGPLAATSLAWAL
jgi:hypothetical protein